MEALGVSSFDFLAFMGTESQILKWKLEGLPIDKLSSQNAMCILNTNATPLLVDPSSQVMHN